MALSRLESKWENTINIKPYYLDLLEYRTISNEIASFFNIEHASPQILLIRNGECFYHNSHNGINMRDVLEVATAK